MKKHIVALSLTACLAAGITAYADNAPVQLDKFSKAQQLQLKAYINQAIPSYLLDNPKILVTVSRKLRNQMQQQQRTDGVNAAKKILRALVKDPQSPTVGKGPITLVEFFDYQCSACHAMYREVDKLKQRNPNLRIVFKELPIFGGASATAAKVGLAAYQLQGPKIYMKFHDAMFSADILEGKLNDDEVMKIAKAQGVNVTRVKKRMNSNAIKNELKQNMQQAQQLKLPGTPALIIAPTNIKNKSKVNKLTFIPGYAPDSVMQEAINQLK